MRRFIESPKQELQTPGEGHCGGEAAPFPPEPPLPRAPLAPSSRTQPRRPRAPARGPTAPQPHAGPGAVPTPRCPAERAAGRAEPRSAPQLPAPSPGPVALARAPRAAQAAAEAQSAARAPRAAGSPEGRPAARSPRQEILAGLGAAEGAAAPGSGGSGIIFYQRRDQLPHPVTGPYTKAQTDLEKLGPSGGGEGETGRGDGPLPCCRPGRRRRTDPGLRRPRAPHESPRRARRRDTARGGEWRGSARPCPAAGARAGARRRGASRAGPEGRPALTMGAGITLLTQTSREKGRAEGYGLAAAQRACAAPRGKAGKRGLEGPRHVPSRCPPGGGRAGPALSGARGGLPRGSLWNKNRGRCPGLFCTTGWRGSRFPPLGCCGSACAPR